MVDVKQLGGYILSVIGLIVLALSFGIFGTSLEFMKGISSIYVSGLGIALIIIGVVIAMMFDKKKVKQGNEEVPIYEGKGKTRKIVGYQRMEK